MIFVALSPLMMHLRVVAANGVGNPLSTSCWQRVENIIIKKDVFVPHAAKNLFALSLTHSAGSLQPKHLMIASLYERRKKGKR
jgi:hypothetical protein